MKKRQILTGAFLLFGLAGCVSGDPEVRALYSVLGQDSLGSSEAWLDRGRKEFAANRCGLAIRYFRNALNKNPSSIPAMNGMAACYDKMKRFDLSERFYRTALAQNPRSVQILNNLGYSYYLQNKPDVAVNYLREAMRRSEQDPLVKNNVRLAETALIKKKTVASNVGKAAIGNSPLGDPRSWQSASKNKVRLIRAGKSRVSLLTRMPKLQWQAAVLQQPLPFKREEEAPVRPERTLRPENVVKSIKTLNTATKSSELQTVRVGSRIFTGEYLLTPAVMMSNAATNQKPLQPVKAVRSVVTDPVPTKKRGGQNEATGKSKVRRDFAIEVSNGTGRRRMASRMRDYLAERRLNVMWLTNAESFSNQVSTIFYKPGAKDAALRLAGTLPVTPRLQQRETQRASLQFELGGDLLSFDKKLIQNNDHATKVSDHVDS